MTLLEIKSVAPAFYKALEFIAFDNGCNVVDSFEVPEEVVEKIKVAEKSLSQLSEYDLEACVGDEAEWTEILEQFGAENVTLIEDLLMEFFDGELRGYLSSFEGWV